MVKIIYFLIVLFLYSCSDTYENLGNGYFYRYEGGPNNDILCENSEGGFIPATVIAYAFDELFIIAKQKPKIPQDILYDKEFNYQENYLGEYYWIIIKKKNKVLGPLSLNDFETLRIKLDIPNNLILE
jgi:hypothetical protein